MKKDRKYTRRRTNDYFLVRHLQTKQIIGRVANVSLGGLMLIATKPLSVHRDYQLQLVFPRSIADKQWIKLSAESRWSKYNSRADWWEIGFEIRQLDPDDVVVLHEVIQYLTVDEVEQVNEKKPDTGKTEVKLEYLKTR